MTFKPQSKIRHQQNPGLFSTRLTLQLGIFCLTGVALMSGCVSSGQYEAEKERALNFQRLLAQEEQRTGELDVRLQEEQQKNSSLESQNRQLSVEVDTLREQVGRQPEMASAKDMAGTAGDMEISPDMSFSDPSVLEFGLNDFSFDESSFKDLDMDKVEATDPDANRTEVSSLGTSNYYTVVKGDTLYRLSRIYGVTVEQLKEWNNLADNIISIGQRLIVKQP